MFSRLLLIFSLVLGTCAAQIELPTTYVDGFGIALPNQQGVALVEFVDGVFEIRNASALPATYYADPPQTLITEWKCSLGTMRVVTVVPSGANIEQMRAKRAEHKHLVEVMQETGGGFEPIT